MIFEVYLRSIIERKGRNVTKEFKLVLVTGLSKEKRF